ncbi:hypothetical protein ACJX0J_020464, partial [Zea mays]
VTGVVVVYLYFLKYNCYCAVNISKGIFFLLDTSILQINVHDPEFMDNVLHPLVTQQIEEDPEGAGTAHLYPEGAGTAHLPLPGRLNVILTRSGTFDFATVENSALELLASTPYCLSIEKLLPFGTTYCTCILIEATLGICLCLLF